MASSAHNPRGHAGIRLSAVAMGAADPRHGPTLFTHAQWCDVVEGLWHTAPVNVNDDHPLRKAARAMSKCQAQYGEESMVGLHGGRHFVECSVEHMLGRARGRDEPLVAHINFLAGTRHAKLINDLHRLRMFGNRAVHGYSSAQDPLQPGDKPEIVHRVFRVAEHLSGGCGARARARANGGNGVGATGATSHTGGGGGGGGGQRRHDIDLDEAIARSLADADACRPTKRSHTLAAAPPSVAADAGTASPPPGAGVPSGISQATFYQALKASAPTRNAGAGAGAGAGPAVAQGGDGADGFEAAALAAAIQASVASLEDQRRKEAAERERLDAGVAASLHSEAPAGTWSCARCTLDNAAEAGRCSACSADRHTPFAAANPAGAQAPAAHPRRCGLPGCTRPRVHHDFCCPEHEQRAAKRRLLPPPDDATERVFLGHTGEYSCLLLTRRSAERGELISQFGQRWGSGKGTPPRVEHVYRVLPSPLLVERFARYSNAVGNVRKRYHGCGAACPFGIDLKVRSVQQTCAHLFATPSCRVFPLGTATCYVLARRGARLKQRSLGLVWAACLAPQGRPVRLAVVLRVRHNGPGIHAPARRDGAQLDARGRTRRGQPAVRQRALFFGHVGQEQRLRHRVGADTARRARLQAEVALHVRVRGGCPVHIHMSRWCMPTSWPQPLLPTLRSAVHGLATLLHSPLPASPALSV